MSRGLHRIISAVRNMGRQDAPALASRRGTRPAHAIREDTFPTATTIPDIIPESEKPLDTLGGGWTTGLLIQFLGTSNHDSLTPSALLVSNGLPW